MLSENNCCYEVKFLLQNRLQNNVRVMLNLCLTVYIHCQTKRKRSQLIDANEANILITKTRLYNIYRFVKY